VLLIRYEHDANFWHSYIMLKQQCYQMKLSCSSQVLAKFMFELWECGVLGGRHALLL